MQEIWKDIPGYEGRYQASSLGRIKSLSRRVNTWNASKTIPECVLKASGRRYKQVRIDGKMQMVHRLVALTFIPVIAGKFLVNHRDEDTYNNRVENLEWCTPKENVRYNNAHLRRAKTQKESGCQLNNRGTSKPILCIDTGQVYPSIQEAVRTHPELDASTLTKVCKGKKKTHKGRHWRYVNE